MFAKVNGGTIGGVLENKYNSDYVIEKRLNDDRLQRLRERLVKKDPKRNNNSQNYRELATKRRLVVLSRRDAENNSRSPVTEHRLGSVPFSSKLYSSK